MPPQVMATTPCHEREHGCDGVAEYLVVDPGEGATLPLAVYCWTCMQTLAAEEGWPAPQVYGLSRIA